MRASPYLPAGLVYSSGSHTVALCCEIVQTILEDEMPLEQRLFEISLRQQVLRARNSAIFFQWAAVYHSSWQSSLGTVFSGAAVVERNLWLVPSFLHFFKPACSRAAFSGGNSCRVRLPRAEKWVALSVFTDNTVLLVRMCHECFQSTSSGLTL